MNALDAISQAMAEREKDTRLRGITESTVAEVIRNTSDIIAGRPIGQRDLHHLLTKAVTLALVRTYESDGEIKMLRTERDQYRKIALELSELRIYQPVIHTADPLA